MNRYFLSIIFLLLFSVKGVGQQKEFVQHQGIHSPLHQANIGKLRFSSEAIALDQYKESDFLSYYELTNRSNLYIHAFLATSLTNHLHRLAPPLSPEEIVKIGNYHFSFYLDERLIYQESLHPGGPLPKVKNTETVLSKPLINNENSGAWWSQSLWNRFLVNGGDSALTEGKHLFKMEIRSYVKNPALKIGDILATGQLALDVKKPKIDTTTINLNPIKPYKGLAISKASFDRDKVKELIANIQEAVFKNITSIVVLKNGQILMEEYFNDANRNTLHDPRSVGKSFASTMMGIAIGEGHIKDEDQTLGTLYPLRQFANYSPQKASVSIKELLTMSSIFAGNDNVGNSPGNEENMYPTPNWVRFALDLPIDTVKTKGEWNYFTAGVVLLGDVLHKKVPGGLDKYADAKLFKLLGITQYRWQYTPQNVANTAGGIQMNALDFAKYGQLYKNRGVWNGKPLLAREWVDKTFTKHKSIADRTNEWYGYLFWNKTYHVKGKAYETFYCAGNGGNKIYVFKDQPLVIVITATAYGAPFAHSQVDTMMENYILPAVVSSK